MPALSHLADFPARPRRLPDVLLNVPGDPVPQGSKIPFRRRNGTIGLREANKMHGAWREVIALHAKAYRAHHWGQLPLDGPLVASMLFTLWPPSKVMKGAANATGLPAVVPDLSKLIRCVEDSLSKVLIHDDARIVAFHDTGKVYGDDPGVLIKLWKLK